MLDHANLDKEDVRVQRRRCTAKGHAMYMVPTPRRLIAHRSVRQRLRAAFPRLQLQAHLEDGQSRWSNLCIFQVRMRQGWPRV